MKKTIFILETGLHNNTVHFFYIFSTKEKAIKEYIERSDDTELEYLAVDDYSELDEKNALITKSEIDTGYQNDLYA